MCSLTGDQNMPVGAARGRELDCRVNDGMRARLPCLSTTRPCGVAVSDSKTETECFVETRDRGSALDVFHHPYAYGAHTRAVSAALARDSLVSITGKV